MTTEDKDLLCSGASALAAYVRIAGTHLLNWKSDDGTSGLQILLRVIERLLDPSLSDSGAMNVGFLIDKMITTYAGQLNQIIPDILNASLNRLSVSSYSNLTEGLLIVFIRMFILNFDETIQFLASNSFKGENALSSLLSIWVASHDNFAGDFKLKLSIVGLCKIFQYSSDLLDQISVKGDLEPETTKRQTRSQTKGETKHLNETLKLRIFKILVREHMVTYEKENTKNISDEDIDDSTDEDYGTDDDPLLEIEEELGIDLKEFETDEDFNLSPSFIPIGAFLDYDEFTTEELIEDPSITSDPIYSINILSYITEFLNAFANQNRESFLQYAERLPSFEISHLKRIIQLK